MSEVTPQEAKQENPLLSLVCNVLLPVLILHKLSRPMGPLPALLLALTFPLAYGVFDYLRKQKLNPLSALGFLNVSVTGGLAVLGLGGIWFSVKEAFFPLLIGIFVLLSAFREKPFIKTIFLNPQLLHLDRILEALTLRDTQLPFEKLLKKSTVLLSLSFFLSAILNFILSLFIFIDLDSGLNSIEKSVLLNEQIARMTQWAFLVILIPSMLFLIFIIWHLLKGIRELTGLKNEEILKQ